MPIDRRKRSSFAVHVPAAVGEPVRASRRRSALLGLVEIDAEQQRASFCASCRRVMADVTSVGGVCVSCGLVICSHCAEARCAICNACTCDNNGCSSLMGNAKVCRSHGFFAYLKFAFVNRR